MNGAYAWETPVETDQRKRIAYLIMRRPRELNTLERRVLTLLYSLDGPTPRADHAYVALVLTIPEADIPGICRVAFKKIFYATTARRRSPRSQD